MMVLTTESTGKSERFKRLKERLDPKSQIDHYSLKNLARLVEEFYYHANTPEDEKTFQCAIEEELGFLKDHGYAYAILGCTHYPLVKNRIEKYLNLKAISPDAHVAKRVAELSYKEDEEKDKNIEDTFYFYSSHNNQWTLKKRASLLGPFS
jgi:glutamate racemase